MAMHFSTVTWRYPEGHHALLHLSARSAGIDHVLTSRSTSHILIICLPKQQISLTSMAMRPWRSTRPPRVWCAVIREGSMGRWTRRFGSDSTVEIAYVWGRKVHLFSTVFAESYQVSVTNPRKRRRPWRKRKVFYLGWWFERSSSGMTTLVKRSLVRSGALEVAKAYARAVRL